MTTPQARKPVSTGAAQVKSRSVTINTSVGRNARKNHEPVTDVLDRIFSCAM